MNFRRRTSILAACVAATAIAAVPSAGAKTFKVTTKADEADGACKKKDCSIREAIEAADANMGKDKIVVPKANYKLSLGQLSVDAPAKIKGGGARRTTISGDNASRVLTINAGPTSVSGLTITKGNSQLTDPVAFAGDGGGMLITSSERVTLSQVTVTRNQAQMSGGGIIAPFESGVPTNVKIKRSSITRNTVSGGAGDGSGGGILVAGDLSLTNSTVAKNSLENATSTNRGGGVSVMTNAQAGGGTGIATLTLSNATIVKNKIAGSAMDGIGGGIGLSDPLMGQSVAIDARNTIVAQNKVVGAKEDCGMVMSGVTSKANLSSDETCMFDDKKSITNKKPRLRGLRINGGQTETMLPRPQSPAVDAGTNKKCKSPDQRGVKRPQGKSCDIGAVELRKGEG